MKERTKQRPMDGLVVLTAQDYAHRSTDDIVRRRIVLCAEADVVDAEIVELNAKLATARRVRAGIAARLTGLRIVVEKR